MRTIIEGGQMETPRQKLIKEMSLTLGGGMVDVELDPEHYDFAIDAAVERYRQRAANAVEESFVFLEFQTDVSSYTLPNEVQTVRACYRRTIGGSAGGAAIDPFSLSFVNNIYMIQNPGGLGGGGSGTLATYDMAMQFQELAGRMFGRDLLYVFDPVSKKITFQRKFHSPEHVVLHVYNERPEDILLKDPYSKPWLRDFATAKAKMMIGEARSKFQSLGGPQGGVTLNGEALKQEAAAEFERLEMELKNLADGSDGYPFIIG
jgi:hypothetical protein